MFNIDHSVAAIRNADAILSNKLLMDFERELLLGSLVETLPATSRIPHVIVARTAIVRKLGELHGKDRTTKGVTEQAEVAESAGSTEAEASERSTEGVEEQAEDAGDLSSIQPKRHRRKASRTPTQT